MPVDISTFENVSLLQGQHPYRGPGRVGPARNLFSEGLPAGLVPILSAENTVRYTLLNPFAAAKKMFEFFHESSYSGSYKQKNESY